MQVELLEVGGRAEVGPADPASPADFVLRPAGRIALGAVAASPDWSLHALDVGARQALLVELPPGEDLSRAAFVYDRQRKAARRAVLLSFENLMAAARDIPPPRSLAFLFSTGRCGSTLASRLLARLPEAWSLSEPDWLTNLALARDRLAPGDLAALVRAATLWTCRPPAGRAPEVVVIKPRSEAVLIAAACHAAFPDSRNLFLYRDLLGYADSLFRFAQQVLPEAIRAEEESWRGDIWDIMMVGLPETALAEWFAPDHGPIGWSEFLTLVWDLRIGAYLRALRQGMDFAALHYRDLDRDRAEGTARLLAACGLSPERAGLALAAFAQDSHEGGVADAMRPAQPLDAVQKARATALLARLGRRDYLAERLPDRDAPGGRPAPA